MISKEIQRRLEGICDMLLGVHKGKLSSTASVGREREAFINGFLSEVFPPHFRFGSGDAIDSHGNRSGQLDIVLEYPFLPSIPMVVGNSPRLYLAEGVVAVIEVKSNLKSQWKQAKKTAEQLGRLSREYDGGVSIGPRPIERIPLYIVGYGGWKGLSSLRSKVEEADGVDGALDITNGNFFGTYTYLNLVSKGNGGNKTELDTKTWSSEGNAMALWDLISVLHFATSFVTSSTKTVPSLYNN